MKCCSKNCVNVGIPKKRTNKDKQDEKKESSNYDHLPTTTVTLTDGSIYTGTVQDDKIHGKGILKYPNGEQYEGEFINGKKDGIGKWSDKEGNTYEGSWLDDKKHGYGIYKTKEGLTFEGNFENNIRQGKGTITANDNTRYICFFKDDVEEGEVEFFFSNGDHALGYIKDGYLDKNGRYEFKNGDIYVGNFENGMFHGKGYYKWNDNSSFTVYDGEYFQGKKQGAGKLTKNCGTVLIGEFKDNHLHGEVLEISPQGNQTKVLYSNGNYVKIIEKLEEIINVKEVRAESVANTTIFSDPNMYKKLYEIEKKKKAKIKIQLKK
ncbi:MORN repeat protein [Plasmodium brasilianum]|uniref:MORN repeat protein n=1 Tax=Plasmodium brasilianum TaxID=5824 RepID=A0ACB9Y677_PLABR|nr:MORN repeat protein [Plasmodium brasilianum]